MFYITRNTERKADRVAVMLSVNAPSAADALTLWALVNRQEAEGVVESKLSALSEHESDE